MLRDDPQGLDYYRQPKSLGLSAAGKGGTYMSQISRGNGSIYATDWRGKSEGKVQREKLP